MVFFKKKKLIPPKRVCLRLKEARKKRGLSLDQLAKKTKISKEHLQALEECRFCDLPEAEVYQKSYVKKYVEALDINSESFLQQYLSEETVERKTKHPSGNVKSQYLHNLPIVLRYSLAIILVFSLFFYLGWQVKKIVEPPDLVIYAPLEGQVTEDFFVLLQGETNKEVQVAVNGKSIRTNEQGEFSEMIDLSAGVNTLVIEAKKKHGKITKITRHVTLRQVE